MKLSVFDFQDIPVRVIQRNDQPWFVAADVCSVLDIANNRDAVASLDDDEKEILTTSNVGNADISLPSRGLQAISESGIYALIFKSRKPQAKAFRKWVTSEVLPALRKTGVYQVPVTEAVEPPRMTIVEFLQSIAPGVWGTPEINNLGQITRALSHNIGAPLRRQPDPYLDGECVRAFPLAILALAYGTLRQNQSLSMGRTKLPELNVAAFFELPTQPERVKETKQQSQPA